MQNEEAKSIYFPLETNDEIEAAKRSFGDKVKPTDMIKISGKEKIPMHLLQLDDFSVQIKSAIESLDCNNEQESSLLAQIISAYSVDKPELYDKYSKKLEKKLEDKLYEAYINIILCEANRIRDNGKKVNIVKLTSELPSITQLDNLKKACLLAKLCLSKETSEKNKKDDITDIMHSYLEYIDYLKQEYIDYLKQEYIQKNSDNKKIRDLQYGLVKFLDKIVEHYKEKYDSGNRSEEVTGIYVHNSFFMGYFNSFWYLEKDPDKISKSFELVKKLDRNFVYEGKPIDEFFITPKSYMPVRISELIIYGCYQEAEDYVNEAIKQYPEASNLLLQKALLYCHLENLSKKPKEIYIEIIDLFYKSKKTPDEKEECVLQSIEIMILLHQENFPEANRKLQQYRIILDAEKASHPLMVEIIKKLIKQANYILQSENPNEENLKSLQDFAKNAKKHYRDIYEDGYLTDQLNEIFIKCRKHLKPQVSENTPPTQEEINKAKEAQEQLLALLSNEEEKNKQKKLEAKATKRERKRAEEEKRKRAEEEKKKKEAEIEAKIVEKKKAEEKKKQEKEQKKLEAEAAKRERARKKFEEKQEKKKKVAEDINTTNTKSLEDSEELENCNSKLQNHIETHDENCISSGKFFEIIDEFGSMSLDNQKRTLVKIKNIKNSLIYQELAKKFEDQGGKIDLEAQEDNSSNTSQAATSETSSKQSDTSSTSSSPDKERSSNTGSDSQEEQCPPPLHLQNKSSKNCNIIEHNNDNDDDDNDNNFLLPHEQAEKGLSINDHYIMENFQEYRAKQISPLTPIFKGLPNINQQEPEKIFPVSLASASILDENIYQLEENPDQERPEEDSNRWIESIISNDATEQKIFYTLPGLIDISGSNT